MLRIESGRAAFYQWDVDQRLIVEHPDVVEVAFDNSQTRPALVCTVYEEDGVRYANVPNILLQQALTLRAYGSCSECVRAAAAFAVIRRERPADYVYTETEVLQYSNLERRVAALEASGGGTGGSGGGSEAPGKDGEDGEDGGYYTPTVAQPNANTMRMSFTPSKSNMPQVSAQTITLPAGKDGADGQPGRDGVDGQPGKDGSDGAPGKDGKTPVKGTDYWTAADRAQMVSDVLAALPSASGVKY